jgi:hypothetical protein
MYTKSIGNQRKNTLIELHQNKKNYVANDNINKEKRQPTERER